MSVCIKLPTMKSRPANSRISKRINCNFMTHLTPATFITPNRRTAAPAINLTAHIEFPRPISSAMDSPNPSTFNAHPTALK